MKKIFFRTLLTMTIVLFIFLVITLLIPFLAFKSVTSKQLETSGKNVVVIAHRGASGYCPENTIPSFQKALEMGADILELDVHLSQDGKLIVMHDNKVDRTTDGKGEINKLSFEQIRRLDAGGWFDEAFRGAQVPTLDEVLDLAKGKAKVLIEIKWPSKGLYKGIVGQVLQVIKNHQGEKWTIIQSFERAYLEESLKMEPKIECQQLVFGKSNLLPIYFERSMNLGFFKPMKGVSSINIFYLYLNKSFLESIHAETHTVYVFTPNKKEDMLRALNLGADGLITNYPDVALKLLNR